jgi:uncharacterized metal-binding protein
MHAEEASSCDERPALKADLAESREAAILTGCSGASSAARIFANIALAMDSENGPAAVSESRPRL